MVSAKPPRLTLPIPLALGLLLVLGLLLAATPAQAQTSAGDDDLWDFDTSSQYPTFRGSNAVPTPATGPTRNERFQHISVGSDGWDWDRACGVKTNGEVVCWRSDENIEIETPSGTFRQVSVGRNHACGVKTGGEVVCWAWGSDPRAGPDPFRNTKTPTGTFQQVSAGWGHTCGVKTSGQVVCWGWSQFGQATPPPGTFKQVSAGLEHTCGVKTDSEVVCWGGGLYQRGQAMAPTGTFQQVSSGWGHTCGVKTDGEVICWGDDGYGKSTVPTGTFQQVSAGGDYTCGVKTGGKVACWGGRYFGDVTPPTGTFQQVSAGEDYACGVKTDGEVVCWADSRTKVTWPSGEFQQVSAYDDETCGIMVGGEVACWGANLYTAPPAGSFRQVSVGGSSNCGVKTGGEVVCWANDDFGLAQSPAGAFQQVSAGSGHACGIRAGGEVACWDLSGAPGYYSTPPMGTFRQVSAGNGGLTCGVKTDGEVVCWSPYPDEDRFGAAKPPAGAFQQVSARGNVDSCGLKTSGEVVCWGGNLGRTPGPSGTFKQVSTGEFHACGVKTNGDVACWGNDGYGRATAPSGTFQQVSAGDLHTCGVKTGGEIVCWGLGAGSRGGSVGPTRPGVMLTAPTNVVATVSGSSVTVTWTDGQGAAGHLVRLYQSDLTGEPRQATAAGSSHTFRDVPPGDYIASVIAFDADAHQEFASSSVVTVVAATVTQSDILGNPTNLRVAAVGDGQVTLEWEAAENADTQWIAWYRVNGTDVLVDYYTAPGTWSQFIVTDLENGQLYAFVVIAARSIGGELQFSEQSNRVEATPGQLATDRAALIALYNATDGPNWKNIPDNEIWRVDDLNSSISDWHGVTTNAAGRVTRLILWNRGLNGTIPPGLGNLTHLTDLRLGGNQLSGKIPGELGRLVNLTVLNLGGNQLTGNIPGELVNLVNLEVLSLDNDLTGPIPTWLGDLSHLRQLNLGYNLLTGPIPSELGTLTNLEWLYLSGNQLTGPIPPALGVLSSLERLTLDNNNLSGPVPAELADLTNLEWLVIGGTNQLDECLPTGIRNLDLTLDDLHTLDIPPCDDLGNPSRLIAWPGGNAGEAVLRWTPGANATVHEIAFLKQGGEEVEYWPPVGGDARGVTISGLEAGQDYWFAVRAGRGASESREWSDYSNVVQATAGSGRSLSAATDRAALIALYAATGGDEWVNGRYDYKKWVVDDPASPVSEWYGVTADDSGRVTRLSLRNNQLSGDLPAELGDLTELVELNLEHNQLTGPIPPELGNLANLEILSLSANRLNGAIPPELGDLTGLRWLNLEHNELTGAVPPEVGDLENLGWLNLEYNQLSGEIPAELGFLSNLESLKLGHNRLRGTIPPELGNLSNLRLLYLDNQSFFNGLTWRDIGSVANLERQRSNVENYLHGEIPAGLGNLENLEVLDLGRNRLNGGIPDELGRLRSLEVLDLSHNGLSGGVPDWRLREFGWGDMHIQHLDLSHNQLSGYVAPVLVYSDTLVHLDLSNNDLEGFMWLLVGSGGNYDNLETIDLSHNRLSGNITHHITHHEETPIWSTGSWARLQELDLSVNNFEYVTLSELYNLPRLTELNLKGNPELQMSEAVVVENEAGIERDKAALMALYNAAGGDNWTNRAGWNTDAPIGEWHGVTVATAIDPHRPNRTGRVIGLDLHSNNLVGDVNGLTNDLFALLEEDFREDQNSALFWLETLNIHIIDPDAGDYDKDAELLASILRQDSAVSIVVYEQDRGGALRTVGELIGFLHDVATDNEEILYATADGIKPVRTGVNVGAKLLTGTKAASSTAGRIFLTRVAPAVAGGPLAPAIIVVGVVHTVAGTDTGECLFVTFYLESWIVEQGVGQDASFTDCWPIFLSDLSKGHEFVVRNISNPLAESQRRFWSWVSPFW